MSMAMPCDADWRMDPTNLQPGYALELRAKYAVDLPNHTSDHDRFLPPKRIGEYARDKSTEPGSTGHGGRDTALDGGLRTETGSIFGETLLVEVASVRLDWKTGDLISRKSFLPRRRTTYIADMEAISKPKRPPPITAMAAMKYMFEILYILGSAAGRMPVRLR